VDALSARIDTLSAQLAKLAKGAPAKTAAKPAAKSNGTTKPAAKRAAARKSA